MKSKHPGTVGSDAQAFQQISSRFQSEVGRIVSSIDFVRGPVPFWALMRMMFPVAESLGDLIYRKDRKDQSTAQNLRSILENEFEAIRPGYRGKAAVLAVLYRHSLTHHDELRTIASNGKEVGWSVSGADDANHLQLRRTGASLILIEFQPRAFYADIVGVCKKAEESNRRGEVMRRYNGWMALDLDSEIRKKRNGTFAAARTELAAF